MHVPSFQYFFHKNLLVLFKNVFSQYNTSLIECKKGPFLDINIKKTRFCEGQKPRSQQK